MVVISRFWSICARSLAVTWVVGQSALAFGGESLPLEGSLQLWTRDCPNSPASCGLPIAEGEPQTILGTVAPPPENGLTGSSFMATKMFGVYEVRLYVFQKAKLPSGEGASSTSYQVSVTDLSQGRIISECSSFEPLQTSLYFPVGACSGEVPGSDGRKRVGVTFRRLRLP